MLQLKYLLVLLFLLDLFHLFLFHKIFLYIHQGFLLQITDTFANYDNQYLLAMKTLKNILSKQQYTELVTYSE